MAALQVLRVLAAGARLGKNEIHLVKVKELISIRASVGYSISVDMAKRRLVSSKVAYRTPGKLLKLSSRVRLAVEEGRRSAL